MSFNDDLEQSNKVDGLIANLSINPNDEESRAELKRIAKAKHNHDCALGSVPACTCGKREAEEFFKPPAHDHSQVIHGRSPQTDRFPDGCLVNPDWQLGH